jgi:hypothetical protein
MFRNSKTQSGSEVLRIKDNEELEAAVERLSQAGWQIPDLARLEVGNDSVGKFFKIKGSKVEDTESKGEDKTD